MKTLPRLGLVVLEGSVPEVMDWLDTNRWAETTINVYYREDEGELRANAVCDCKNDN
jgi:hypothetical protein